MTLRTQGDHRSVSLRRAARLSCMCMVFCMLASYVFHRDLRCPLSLQNNNNSNNNRSYSNYSIK